MPDALETDGPNRRSGRSVQNGFRRFLIVRPLVLALIIRVLSLFYFLLIHPYSISPSHSFDTSSSIHLQSSGNPTTTSILKYLEPFHRWDTLYFTDIALHGYRYEQEFAFLPVWPGCMRLAGEVVRRGRGWWEGGAAREIGVGDVLVGGIVLANICSLLAVIAFQRLTFSLTRSKPFTTLSTLLYALNPVPGITSSPCTEPLFALLTFIGYCLASSPPPNTSPFAPSAGTARRKVRWMRIGALNRWAREGAGIACLALAAGTRSLGVLAVIVVGWPMLERLWVLRLRSFRRTVIIASQAALKAVVIISPFILFQYYGYRAFCGHTSGDSGSHRPWCEKRLPLIYSFVQNHYWNVGFMRYWTPSQLPNFLLPAPILFISLYGLYLYYKPLITPYLSSPSQTRSRQKAVPAKQQADIQLWNNPKLRPYFLIHLITTLTLIFTAHVQIALRTSITNPVIWWSLAGVMVEEGDGRGTRRLSQWGRRWVCWCGIWGTVSLVLWAGFYPPA